MIRVINYASGEILPAMIINNPDQSLTLFALINARDKKPYHEFIKGRIYVCNSILELLMPGEWCFKNDTCSAFWMAFLSSPPKNSSWPNIFK